MREGRERVREREREIEKESEGEREWEREREGGIEQWYEQISKLIKNTATVKDGECSSYFSNQT